MKTKSKSTSQKNDMARELHLGHAQLSVLHILQDSYAKHGKRGNDGMTCAEVAKAAKMIPQQARRTLIELIGKLLMTRIGNDYIVIAKGRGK